MYHRNLVLCALLVIASIAAPPPPGARRLRPAHSQVVRGEPAAELYMYQQPVGPDLTRWYTGAKYEPKLGCYLGAFIDFDGDLRQTVTDANHIVHRDPKEFEAITGRTHATYFFYLGYGKPLPLAWVKHLAAEGKMVQVALEPNDGMESVRDGAYLTQLAQQMKASGAHIFLRFGAEMNGSWTAYHPDPALFREKFRLVHDVMARLAPNVAMVWCPYMIPTKGMDAYYPGDDAVDWVGVNMYSVTLHNNLWTEPGAEEHPCDLLRYVYDHYAARKPIMICEYGATHDAAAEDRTRASFAIRAILTLYASLPRIYPRVKCINYFDGDAIHFVPGHPYNDYSITDDPTITAAYREAISSPWFLGAEEPADDPPAAEPMPLLAGTRLSGLVHLTCWARGRSDRVVVRYFVDGRGIYAAALPNDWDFTWDSGSVKPGLHRITLRVFNSAWHVIASKSVLVRTGPALPVVPPPPAGSRHHARRRRRK
ncbi:MAG: hypothetical protein KGJ62_08460 [Armatimonadetes bacterium]|nr:hypothetical protein [Armatimonadota bacterium]MDE2205076.1 hypothetical protein [Armatimonadota bacterium]